jgi:hypothetical protein
MTLYLYFLLWYRLHHQDGYLIWITANADISTVAAVTDRVLVDETGKLLIFLSTAKAIEYSNLFDWKLEDDVPVLHNLDSVRMWLSHPSASVNCYDFLAAWNLFTDVSQSINGQDFIVHDPFTDRIYDKLFWGNNLPSVTPNGAHYEPAWSAQEITQLQRVFKSGLELFITSLPSS